MACLSPDEYRLQADRQVEGILSELETALTQGMSFPLERPEDTLRARFFEGPVPSEEEQVLGLVDCLRLAAENSREFQTQREALYRAALALTLERWRFSIQDTGTASTFLERNGTPVGTAGVLSNYGLSKLFRTGASVFSDLGLTLVRDVSSGDGWDAISNLRLGITQPLLQGFGRDVVLEPLTQAERDVLYQARSFERFRRVLAFDVTASYYRILQQVNTISNEQQNYDGLVELRRRNEAFAEAGRLSDIQVDQARQNELRARNRLIDAERFLGSLKDDFLFFLGLPIEYPWRADSSELEGLEVWPELESRLGETQALTIALAERLDHQTTLDQAVDTERRIGVRANDLEPGLDIVADYSDASGVRPSWGISLDLDLPLNRLPERNVYREALILRDAAQRAVEASRDRILTQVRESLRELRAVRQSFDIQTGAVGLAESRVESAKLNLEAGRASTRDVLEAQDALIQAQNAAVRARTDLALAGLAYHQNMELLRVGEDGLRVAELPEWLQGTP